MQIRFYKATSTLSRYRGKYRSLALLALCLFNTGCASFRSCGPGDEWRGPDKTKHFGGSALVAGGVTALAAQDQDSGEAAAVGIGVALAVGAGKELYDLNVKQTCWSWKDLAWDFLGASIGATLAAQAAD